MKAPKVHIIDDDVTLCQSLEYLFDSVKIPIETYHSPADFLKGYTDNAPGCLLLDVRMPEMSGLTLQDLLIKKQVSLPVIFMSGHADIEMAVRVMKKGAFDFFTKPFNHQLLLEAIHRAVSYSEKSYLGKVTSHVFSRLTSQEHTIIKLIISGRSSKDIAQALSLSQKTIEYHRSKIMRKLDVKNLAELIQLYCNHKEFFKKS